MNLGLHYEQINCCVIVDGYYDFIYPIILWIALGSKCHNGRSADVICLLSVNRTRRVQQILTKSQFSLTKTRSRNIF